MIRTALFLLSLATPALPQSPLPFDVGGPYRLTNPYGETRTQADPEGHAQLLFSGYANCPGICSAAMPLMADVVDSMAKHGIPLRPVMITVDPKRDTPFNMATPRAAYHPAFIGLTGDTATLQTAYDAFNIDHEPAYTEPQYGPAYSHGSLIYLMDARGDLLTIVPPVLDATRAAHIILKYLQPGQ